MKKINTHLCFADAITIMLSAFILIVAVASMLNGCSTAPTKGWRYPRPCVVDGFPCRGGDSSLLPASKVHQNGGMVVVYECINPDLAFPHTYPITNWYNVPVRGVPVWKP